MDEKTGATKCLCNNPVCAKCLSSNCQDKRCSIHTNEHKETWRRRWENANKKPFPHPKNYINRIQGDLIEIAKEFESRGGTNETVLREMIENDKDRFIQIAINYKKFKDEPYQFDYDSADHPEKILKNIIFGLYIALESMTPSPKITSKLIDSLKDAILENFAI